MRKPMARAVVALVVAALAALTLASCGDDADIPSNADVDASLPTSVATVQSTSSGIDPTSITVMAGDAVTFANADTKPHRIVADDHSFDTVSCSRETRPRGVQHGRHREVHRLTRPDPQGRGEGGR